MTPHKQFIPRTAVSTWASLPTQRKIGLSALFLLMLALPVFAALSGSNPWENAVESPQTSFTGPIAKGLSLVAIVVGGLMFAFGEGGSKKMLSGIVFGLGMVLGATNFISWLFPGG